MGSSPDFTMVTEVGGDPASQEQIERLHRRYYWAGSHAARRDVLEIACGAGQGLGYLAGIAARVVGADISDPVLEAARRHYGGRVELQRFDAEQIPYDDASFDLVVMFEAIYYLRDAERFVAEAHRVLRDGGMLLLSSANKDLFDFTPSAQSVKYFGVIELRAMLESAGFHCRFFGDTDTASVSARQRALRRVKQIVTRLGLMPRNKHLKAVLKRLVFGPISRMPAEVVAGQNSGQPLAPIDGDRPDTRHKVLCCEATKGA